jgi:hypothetical protein
VIILGVVLVVAGAFRARRHRASFDLAAAQVAVDKWVLDFFDLEAD